MSQYSGFKKLCDYENSFPSKQALKRERARIHNEAYLESLKPKPPRKPQTKEARRKAQQLLIISETIGNYY